MANLKPIIAAYTRRICKKQITIDEVPANIQEEVIEAVNEIQLQDYITSEENQNGSDFSTKGVVVS